MFRWARTHPYKTVLLLIGVFIAVEAATIPYAGIAQLRTVNPGETALMRQRLREAADAGKPLRIIHRWIPLARIPRPVIDAIVVAEDGTFFSHGGVDWFEVQESIEKNIRERRTARGASTITQQLAKNLYLSTSKDPLRKVKELAITLLLERSLSKARILELYVNVIEWGRGVFGIEAASQAYFGKSADALTLEEATRLAAVIPSPLRHRADEDSRYVLRRKAIVLARMAARNMVPHTVDSTAGERAPVDSTEAEPVDSLGVDEEELNGF
ncbi:MAG: monofunctional biosynthetic peptidoglycan transglycosylase [Bacteroidota bacterium]